MKFLLLCIFVPALSMGGVTKSPLDETFEEFLESNHEYVEQGEQYEAEKAAFEKHQKHAIDNNADASSTHTETLYPGISELTDEEFAAAHLGGMIPEGTIEESRARGGIADPESLRNDPVEYGKFMELKARLESRHIEERTPAAYSAVDNGLVSAVKHQGSCGSCAAFAATAAFETCMLKAGAPKADMDLSEQWLLNCAYQTKAYPHIRIWDGSPTVNGCKGAVAYVYGLWFKDNGGQAPHERSQTYTSGSSKTVEACNKSLTKYNSGAKVSNVVYARTCDAQTLKQMIHQKGHAMIAVFASEPQFANYRSGVLSTCSNNRGTNHAVLAVGYGTEHGQDYWLVKNSWGTNWGESGYIKVKMGTCGIESTGCTVSECTGTGKAGPAPPKPKPPPATQTCDLSVWFGNRLNGFQGTINLSINWTHYSTRVKCTGNSKCQCLETLKKDQNCCQAVCGMNKCPPSNWY